MTDLAVFVAKSAEAFVHLVSEIVPSVMLAPDKEQGLAPLEQAEATICLLIGDVIFC